MGSLRGTNKVTWCDKLLPKSTLTRAMVVSTA